MRSSMSSVKPASTTQSVQSSSIKKNTSNKKECVQCILQFLSWKEYVPCSAKDLLRSPPLQVLLNIWNFLFRLVDENMNITKENMAVEVPKFFKEFGYPQLMKTSHLRTPTADHQWESNLVALAWLCKILMYEQQQFSNSYVGNAPRFGPSYLLGSRGRAPIRNNRVAQTLTDLTTRHFQLYTEGSENSRQLAADFENVLNSLGVELEQSVVVKLETYEELRSNVLQLQEYLHDFESAKERVKTLREEVKKVEEFTIQVKDSCTESENQLRKHQETLEIETENLNHLIVENEQLSIQIDAQTVSRDKIRQLNDTTSKLRTQIVACERQLREYERDEPLLNSNCSSLGNTITKLSKGITVLIQSILTFMDTNGMDTSFWKSLSGFHINTQGTQRSEILGVPPDVYTRLLDEIIAKDGEAHKATNELKMELEQANNQMSNLCNRIIKEISDISQEMADILKNSLYNNESESQIQFEATNHANMITAAAKEELERNMKVLDETNTKIQEVNFKLIRQHELVKLQWQKFLIGAKNAIRTIESNKQQNCEILVGLINSCKLQHL